MSYNDKVEFIRGMGITDDGLIRQALEQSNGDLDGALDVALRAP
jgi:hypothetical protein